MILYQGVSYPSSLQDELIGRMEAELCAALAQKTLPAETVIDAIDRLGRQVEAGRFDELIAALPVDGAEEYKALAIRMLRRDYLEFRLRTELGADFRPEVRTAPPAGLEPVELRTRPLGVLLHIAAGNAEGLPAFSLAEGLVTGNINILKLPQADNGFSLAVISALIELEPALADFIYVFDTPSSDLMAIKKLAGLADGIVVWGGDAAVSAVRRFAAPGTRLIEWGHKLSFAYLSGLDAIGDDALRRLARHIAETKQLLCSSCQTIFLDTERMSDVRAFCARFLPLLDEAVRAGGGSSLGSRAERTLQTYTARLEQVLDSGAAAPDSYRTALCALLPGEDSELELSAFSGHVPVRRLPQKDLLPALRRKKNYLQTAGLLCPSGRREELVRLLLASGVTRVTDPGDMSRQLPGEAHDGDFPLRRYLRTCTLGLPQTGGSR